MQAVLSIVEPRLQVDAHQRLLIPLSLDELEAIARALAQGKNLGPDRHAIEFNLKLWSVIGQAYHQMILASIKNGILP